MGKIERKKKVAAYLLNFYISPAHARFLSWKEKKKKVKTLLDSVSEKETENLIRSENVSEKCTCSWEIRSLKISINFLFPFPNDTSFRKKDPSSEFLIRIFPPSDKS